MGELNIPVSVSLPGAPSESAPVSVKTPAKSAGVPREVRGGTFVDALAAELAHLVPAEEVRSAVEARAFYDAGLLQQWRILAEVSTELAGPEVLPALEASDDDRVRGIAPMVVKLRHLADLPYAVACLRRQAALPGTSVQEGAQMALKALLIEHGLDAALRHVTDWIHDPLPEVRRCLVEALRPRGVWTAHLTALRRDPEPLAPLLEPVLDDPSLYVRKAVANCLNDVGKDHPEALLRWATRWQSGTPERRWILERGLRGLVKAGHPEALRLLGLAAPDTLSARWVNELPVNVVLNQELVVVVEVTNAGDALARVLAQGVLSGPGRGKTPRVRQYRLGAVEVPAGGSEIIKGRIHFVDFNSQPKLPGIYTLTLVVNGVAVEQRTFTFAR
jgi:3-methyladenine DNA glycosylase AlkC